MSLKFLACPKHNPYRMYPPSNQFKPTCSDGRLPPAAPLPSSTAPATPTAAATSAPATGTAGWSTTWKAGIQTQAKRSGKRSAGCGRSKAQVSRCRRVFAGFAHEERGQAHSWLQVARPSPLLRNSQFLHKSV